MNTKMVIQFQSHYELDDLLTLLQEKAESNPGWESVMCAVKNARPLSELCEEEAKRYDEDIWHHEIPGYQATALRSFGSKQ